MDDKTTEDLVAEDQDQGWTPELLPATGYPEEIEPYAEATEVDW